jgi:hypothetical protein
MLAYTRLKLGWLGYEDILHINQSGTYTLPLADSDGKVAAKIVLNDYLENGEYFMAELRSASLATADCAFDGGLSGDGLIIYRVARENAFINSTGGVSPTEMGNMFGPDELYVFRMNAQKNKKLSAPITKYSYAMLANGKEWFTLDGSYYKYDRYGNSDKTKTLDSLISSSSKSNPSETIICYSDGSNSGIVFKDVTLNNESKTVTFTVELPAEDNQQNAVNSSSVALKSLPNGECEVRWRYTSDYTDVSVMLIRSTNRLRRRAENNSLNLERVFNKAQKSLLYEVLDVKN